MTTSVNSAELKAFIERIENIEVERDEKTEDRKEIYNQLRSEGYDPKVVRSIVKMRKEDRSKREEFESILEVYIDAVGGI